MFLWYSFFENDAGERLFVFNFVEYFYIKMMCQSNFQKVFTFSMYSNQWEHRKSTNQSKTNKIAATEGQIN